MKFPKAILFDLDGVLLDTEPLNRKTWLKTAQYFQCNPNDSQLDTLSGRRKIDCAKKIISWSEKHIELTKLLEVHKRYHSNILGNIRSIEGAISLLEWILEKKIPTALVTSSTFKSVKFKSANNKWLENIKTRVYGDDPLLKAGKPSPDPYLLAAKKLNIRPEECWAVEDSDLGCMSALESRCQVIKLQAKQTTSKIDHISQFKDNIFIIQKLDELLDKLKEYNLNI